MQASIQLLVVSCRNEAFITAPSYKRVITTTPPTYYDPHATVGCRPVHGVKAPIIYGMALSRFPKDKTNGVIQSAAGQLFANLDSFYLAIIICGLTRNPPPAPKVSLHHNVFNLTSRWSERLRVGVINHLLPVTWVHIEADLLNCPSEQLWPNKHPQSYIDIRFYMFMARLCPCW